MIGEALVNLFTGFVKFVIDLLPTDSPPSFVLNAAASLRTVWEYAAGLGAWIPWSFVGIVVATVFACMALGLTIKLARIVASFFTAGGGSAA